MTKKHSIRFQERVKKMLRLSIMSLIVLSTKTFAANDQLLLKRSSRPAMAEGSIEALRPWETQLEGFFVRTHHNTLPIKVDDSWSISFEGLINNPQKISLKALKKKPQTSFHAVLECSGNGRSLFDPPVSGIQWIRGAIGNAEWTGVPIKDLFVFLGIKSGAKFATFEGFDEPVIPSKAKFVRSIPISLLYETGSI
jgi:DMSO/TMAO reductase YedYZ molybdopterin-dependent catalytic subunit